MSQFAISAQGGGFGDKMLFGCAVLVFCILDYGVQPVCQHARTHNHRIKMSSLSMVEVSDLDTIGPIHSITLMYVKVTVLCHIIIPHCNQWDILCIRPSVMSYMIEKKRFMVSTTIKIIVLLLLIGLSPAAC